MERLTFLGCPKSLNLSYCVVYYDVNVNRYKYICEYNYPFRKHCVMIDFPSLNLGFDREEVQLPFLDALVIRNCTNSLEFDYVSSSASIYALLSGPENPYLNTCDDIYEQVCFFLKSFHDVRANVLPVILLFM